METVDETPTELFDFDVNALKIQDDDVERLKRGGSSPSSGSVNEKVHDSDGGDSGDSNGSGGGSGDGTDDDATGATTRNHILDISDTISQIIEPLPSDVRATLDELMPTELVECTYMQVKFLHPATPNLYEKQPQYVDDAGWDLFFPEDITIAARETKRIHLGVAVACYSDSEYFTGSACMMIPRSSIVNTPLRMANSIGLIDAGYRGELIAVVDNCSDEPYEVKCGTRLFQLVGRSLLPFQWTAVEQLPDTERGNDGFGSTGT